MASLPLAVQATPSTDRVAVPASQFTPDQLADIYNQARVDYIVPMPMNGKRMTEYITTYDVDLDASVVVTTPGGDPMGVGMVGFREDRAWITRLGILPRSRGQHVGQFVLQNLIDRAEARRCRLVQLEVIEGNEPAYRMFHKFGFEDLRTLLVIRRPPGKLEADAARAGDTVEEIHDARIPYYLELRETGASWLEETPSLLNTRALRGMEVTQPDGCTGWLIFQRSPFQLTHLVFNPRIEPSMAEVLLYHLHTSLPMQDTKVENLPACHPTWEAFRQTGYFEAFRRVEMTLAL